jgi:Dioxygenases related to 2-nitropropane dioxygenase
MTRSWRSTPVTDMFGLELPIVLGPFGGASSVGLVAAVSNRGGLGSYGLYGLDADRITGVAADIRAATDRPFALNLWLPHGDDPRPDDEAYARYLDVLAGYFDELGLPLPERPARYLVPFDEQIEAAIAARPAALSVVYGVPDAALVDRCRDAGIRLIGTATTVEEARALDAAGVDAIVATGFEAAGHRVSFLRPAEESLVGMFALVPRVVDAVRAPVIAAGGIADGRGVAAALALGASAAQIGTAFLACDESAANPPHRARLWSTTAEETVLTTVFSGRLARGIPNRMSRELSERVRELAPFPVQNWLTGHLKRAAAATGDPDFTSLWAGQAASLVRHRTAAELIAAIEHEVDGILV